MTLDFTSGLKFDFAAQVLTRCRLCRKFFKASDTITIGVDFMLWTHKECYEALRISHSEEEAKIDKR